MTTESTCIVRASDFSNSTADPFRNEWSPLTLSYVLSVLGDTPVAITTDRGSGHTQIGVRLVDIKLRPGHGGASDHRLTIEEEYAPGETQRVNHKIRDLGDTIVPLGRGVGRPGREFVRGVKWDALEAQHEHERAAVSAVHAWMTDHEASTGAEHGPDDERAWYGRVEVSTTTGTYGKTARVYWGGQRQCDRDGNGALPIGGIRECSSAGWQAFDVDLVTGTVVPDAGYGSPVRPRAYARR